MNRVEKVNRRIEQVFDVNITIPYLTQQQIELIKMGVDVGMNPNNKDMRPESDENIEILNNTIERMFEVGVEQALDETVSLNKPKYTNLSDDVPF